MSARYVKPFAMDLVNVEITSGSCLSGTGETLMGNCSATGANALNSCGGVQMFCLVEHVHLAPPPVGVV
jgi:hypothetical protein